MKWMIASDIHGSAFYCRRLKERYKEEGADRLILLGDILYHGPRNDLPEEYAPKQVIALLNDMKNDVICVRGNCDSQVDQMVLEFPILADYALMEVNGRMIFITHGHIYNEDKPPLLHDGDILLYGHTHVPKCAANDKFICMNPGSVSLPKENSYHGYMTLEDGVFLWKDLDGNLKNEYRTDD